MGQYNNLFEDLKQVVTSIRFDVAPRHLPLSTLSRYSRTNAIPFYCLLTSRSKTIGFVLILRSVLTVASIPLSSDILVLVAPVTDPTTLLVASTNPMTPILFPTPAPPKYLTLELRTQPEPRQWIMLLLNFLLSVLQILRLLRNKCFLDSDGFAFCHRTKVIKISCRKVLHETK